MGPKPLPLPPRRILMLILPTGYEKKKKGKADFGLPPVESYCCLLLPVTSTTYPAASETTADVNLDITSRDQDWYNIRRINIPVYEVNDGTKGIACVRVDT